MSKDNAEFAVNCTNGHQLQGAVSFCPYCGSAVTQPVAAGTPASEPSPAFETAPAPAPLPVPVPVPESESESEQLVSVQTNSPPMVEPAPAAPPPKAVVKPVQSLQSEEPKPSAPEVVEKKGAPLGKFMLIFVLLCLVAIAFRFLKGDGGSEKLSACQQVLTEATEQFSQGDFDTALSKVRMGIVSCSGEQLEKATALKRDIEKESVNCNRGIAALQNLLRSKQQVLAQQKVGELSALCAKSQSGRDVALAISKASEPSPESAPVQEAKPTVNLQPKPSPMIATVPEPTAQPPASTQQGTSQVEQNILVKAASDLQGSRLDSALARVNTVLEMNPANADAKRMKAEIRRLQDKAISEIKIE